jgi:hypothetical protein
MSIVKNVEWDIMSNGTKRRISIVKSIERLHTVVLHTEGKTIQVILETQMLLKFSTNSGGQNVLVHVSLSMPPCPWTQTRTGTYRRECGYGQIMLLKFCPPTMADKRCPCVHVSLSMFVSMDTDMDMDTWTRTWTRADFSS